MGYVRLTWRLPSGSARPGRSSTAEALEPRTLLAYAPVGEELRANTFTDFNQISPQIAADADGDFVVAWGSAVQDGSGFGVYAQRYSAAGLRRGGEFRVNSTTFRWQENPSVAMDADGDFVVVWENHENDFERDVFARLYSAGGSPLTGEIVVNQVRGGDQGRPSVAMSDGGDFVVAWDALNQDGDRQGVFARRFSASGAAMTDETPVNTTTAGGQYKPYVAMDADGDFVVAWTSESPGSVTRSVVVRRFTSAGAAQSGELNVATGEIGSRLGLAVSGGGAFVITWGTYINNQGVFSGDIFAQRYTAAGTAAAGPITVNQTIPGAQTDPSAGMDADGNFLIAWVSAAKVGGELDLYARHFNATGVPDGSEFPVNASTAGIQNLPAVAMHDAGGAVIAWHSTHLGINTFDVFAQRFRRDDPPAVTGVFLDSSAWRPAFRALLQARGMGDGDVGYSVPAASQLGIVPWAGIDRVSVRFSEVVTAALDDLSVSGVNVTEYPVTAFEYDAPTRTATWTLSRSLRNDKVLFRLDGDAGGIAGGGALLDGEWTGNAGVRDTFPSGDGAPGGDFAFRINVLPGDVNGDRSVNAIDLFDLRRRLISGGIAQSANSPVHDLNGDSALNAIDLAFLRRYLPSRLPASEPDIFLGDAIVVPRSAPLRRSLLAFT